MTMQWDIGEVAMIDYAGTKMFVIDPNNGERKAVNIFVGILAYSNFTFPTLTLLSTKNRCKSPITWVFSGFNVFTLRSYHSPARSRIPFIFSFSDKACLSS